MSDYIAELSEKLKAFSQKEIDDAVKIKKIVEEWAWQASFVVSLQLLTIYISCMCFIIWLL